MCDLLKNTVISTFSAKFIVAKCDCNFSINFIPSPRNSSINKWIGIPIFLRNDGPPFTLNILDPCANWVNRGSSTSTKLGRGSMGYSDSVSINWNRPTRVLPIYHRRIFEKTCSTAHCACDYLLMENCTYRMQSPPTCRKSICSLSVNRKDDASDDRWDFFVCQ